MTKTPRRRTALAAAVCAAVALLSGQAAHADDDVKFKGGGFGTLGAVRTNVEGVQFRNSSSQWSGADKHVDLGVDSRLGLQGTVSYKSDFALSAQLLGMRREDEDFGIDVEWLYAQYTGVPGLDLKAGRMALPGFLVSDSRRVGYASPWLRTPPLVYSMLYDTVDGIQVNYRHSMGPAVGSVQYTRGRSKATLKLRQAIPGVGTLDSYNAVDADNVSSLNGLLEWGDWTARIGQVKSDDSIQNSITLPAAFGGSTISTPVPSFKDTFTGYGLQYDNGKATVVGEYVTRRTKPKLANVDTTAWYVGGGYRFGDVMPYVLISKSTVKDTKVSTKGAALGVRYDFAKNLALKAEFARYDRGTYIFQDLNGPVSPATKVNVMSVALDFVF